MSRILNRKALREEKGIPFSDNHLRRLVKAGRFPAPIKLGPDPRAHNFWKEHEIDAYLAARPTNAAA